MDKNKMTVIAAGLVALIAVVGIGFMTYAQSADTNNSSAQSSGKAWQGMRGWMGDVLTEEQKSQIRSRFEEQRAAREAKRQEMQAAIAQGYDAWKAKVIETQGENAPILSQVTADEFAKFQEAHRYIAQGQEQMEKARTILSEIGVSGRGMMMGNGFGQGMRVGRFGGAMGGCVNGL